MLLDGLQGRYARAIIECVPENAASLRVALRHGFTYEGTEQKNVKFYGLDGITNVTNTSGEVYVSKADVTVSIGKNTVVLTVNIGLTVTVK